MVRLAGGVDVLGQEGEPSRRTTWETVLELEPEIVILGPCGFDADEAAVRAAGLELPCRALAVDGDAYYSRPAPRLADGVWQLAHLFHPGAVADPELPEFELPATVAAAPSFQS
jgi:iron complex transport system substrate-binding protein